jgi:predicted transcriptional regulator of viral defense system
MMDASEVAMTRQLDLLDTLALEGRNEFTFADVNALLGGSTAAAANTLRRLRDAGLVDRLTRGHYSIRSLGSLGTSAAVDNLTSAVGGVFEGREHRIAYLSALDELGLLSHPVRRVFVACTQQVRFPHVSRRPLRVVIERPETIHLEAEAVRTSWRSSLERALFESALRLDLVGSVERLAEALAAGSADAEPKRIARLAVAFGARGRAAERRLASLATALDLPLGSHPLVARRQSPIRLDPRETEVVWTDDRFKVGWNTTVDELRAVIGN